MDPIDYRVEMTAARFDAIRTDGRSPIDYYYEDLVDRNVRINDAVYQFPSQAVGLTHGQLLLLRLGTFDGQVSNGGITQFFWNHPESMFDVADDIESLGQAGLLANYERALEGLVGKKDYWLTLREQWAKGKDNPSWETFQASYDLLDLGWFDTAYFDRRGYNDAGEWVVLDRGFGHRLMAQLAEYVRSHRDEFIVEPQT